MKIKNTDLYINYINKTESNEPIVSNTTIKNLSNDINFLKSLKLKMQSGSFTSYDAYLYSSLKKEMKLSLANH